MEVHPKEGSIVWWLLLEAGGTDQDSSQECTEQGTYFPTKVLRNIVVEIEAILNKRPLTYLSDDHRFATTDIVIPTVWQKDYCPPTKLYKVITKINSN